jgi:hypothetical protein
MSAHSDPTAGKRILTGDLYGLPASFSKGASYEHLPAGTVFELSKDEGGKVCLLARGRAYTLTHATRYDAIQRSKPV